MKHLIFTFFCFIISCQSKSQDKIDLSRKNISHFEKDAETGWIRVNLNNPNKWGFINRDSVVVIPFEYDFLNPFENGLAYAKNSGKEFFITKKNLKLEGDFEAVDIFSEGLASAKRKNKWGFINPEGKFVISPKYDKVDYFRPSGLCAVEKEGKWGFIDKKGKEIIPIIYPEVNQQMQDINVIAKKNGKWAVFDNQGKQLSDFVYDKIHRTDIIDFSKDFFKRDASTYFGNDAALVERDGKFEFINLKAQAAFPNNKFDSASVFNTFKNAIVKRNEKYGIINTEGKFKIPLEYDFIEPFYHTSNYSEYYNALKGQVYHVFNKELQEIGLSYEKVYDGNSVDKSTLIFRNLENKYGMVDWQGKVLVQFKYDRMDEIEGTPFLRVANGERFGIIDKKGTVKIPIKYKEIYSLYDKFDDEELQNKNLFIADQKIIDISNTIILDGYKVLQPVFYNHSKLIVSKNKKFGIVDVNNNVLLPIQYDEISNWVEYGPRNRHIIKKGNLYGMLDYETFEEKIPVAYDFVFITYNMAFAKKNNKYGIIDLDNKILCPFIYDDLKPAFAYGFGRDNDKVYAKKGKQFYEINLEGKILHTVSRKEFLEKTSMLDLPPPPQK